jgi:transcriptional regulator with XRE-family HTH domain
MSFSARIRRARLNAKLTQAMLATQLHVRRSAVSHWESIAGNRPTATNLAEIAVVTGVRHEWLATGRGPMCIGEQDQASALVLSEFAQDDLESRLLQALRRLPMRRRQLIVDLVEGLGR